MQMPPNPQLRAAGRVLTSKLGVPFGSLLLRRRSTLEIAEIVRVAVVYVRPGAPRTLDRMTLGQDVRRRRGPPLTPHSVLRTVFSRGVPAGRRQSVPGRREQARQSRSRCRDG